MTNYRIRWEKTQWVLQEYRPSQKISQGFAAGQMSKAKWVDVGFHLRLEHAAKAMLDRCMGYVLEIDWTGWGKVLESLEDAQQTVIAAAREAGAEAVREAKLKGPDGVGVG